MNNPYIKELIVNIENTKILYGDSVPKECEDYNEGIRLLAAYSIKMPEFMLFDIDTTLLNACSSQEGAAFNYHPLLAFGGRTGDLMKA